MSVIAAVIGAGAVLGGSILGGNSAKSVANRNNATDLEIAQIPTRISGIDQLLSDLERTATQTESSTLDEFVNQQQQAIDTGTASTESVLNNIVNQQTQSQFSQDETTSMNSDQTTNTASSTDSQASTDQSTNTTANVQGSMEGTVTRGNELNQAALNSLTGELSQSNPLVQEAVQGLVSRIMREGQGDINDTVAQSGTFDSTTEALLRNDLAVKAAESGVALELQQGNTQREQLLQAIAAGQQGVEQTSQLTAEQQQMLEALNSNTAQSAQTNTAESQTGTQSSTTGTAGTSQEGTVSATQQQENTNQQTQNVNNTNSQTSSSANQTSQATSQENTSQQDTNISDQYQNPEQGVRPAQGSALDQLVSTGAVANLNANGEPTDINGLIGMIAQQGGSAVAPGTGGASSEGGAGARANIGNIGVKAPAIGTAPAQDVVAPPIGQSPVFGGGLAGTAVSGLGTVGTPVGGNQMAPAPPKLLTLEDLLSQ